jgi:hypothetical protein
VINHYADSRRIRDRGQPIEGFLLAWSLESMPDQFVHGLEIPAILRIFDQYDRCYQHGDNSVGRSERQTFDAEQASLEAEADLRRSGDD